MHEASQASLPPPSSAVLRSVAEPLRGLQDLICNAPGLG